MRSAAQSDKVTNGSKPLRKGRRRSADHVGRRDPGMAGETLKRDTHGMRRTLVLVVAPMLLAGCTWITRSSVPNQSGLGTEGSNGWACSTCEARTAKGWPSTRTIKAGSKASRAGRRRVSRVPRPG